jgi:CMP-N-acetylneuraminic acid synthetase
LQDSKRSKNEAGKRVLAVIPARGGSKGVPRKNTRSLGGRPLLSYPIRAARGAARVDRLIVSTDDDRILEICRDLDVEVPFIRPPELASDRAPLIAVVVHAYEFFRAEGISYDAVLSLQPTCPFLCSATIDRVIALWLETECECVVTVSEITKGHPYIAKRLKGDHAIESFTPIPQGAVVSPRQARETAYYLTGGIYLRDRRLIERAEPRGHCLGEDPRAVVVDEIEAVDINEEFDLKFADFLIEAGYVKDEDTALQS